MTIDPHTKGLLTAVIWLILLGFSVLVASECWQHIKKYNNREKKKRRG